MSNLIRDALGAAIPQYVGFDGTFKALSKGDTSGVDFSKTILLRDSFGLPIPQLWDAENERWIVITKDGSIVTDIDFSKTKLIRDAFGAAIPQAWDAANTKWIEQTEISFGGGSGGNDSNIGVPLGNGAYQERVTYTTLNATDTVSIVLTEV